jgi:hypothetical protein
MLRQKAHTVLAVIALAVMATLTAGVGTSAAKAPASFYGVVPQTSLGSSDFERMGDGKVGTLRIAITWAAIDQTSAAGDNDWSSVDPVVLEAASNGVGVQPFIFGTPKWVAKGLDGFNCGGSKCGLYAPKSSAALAAFKTFVGEAVDRYGPDGEFWTLHPEVPKDPIHVWQILNEQNSESFYQPKPSPKGYAKVLAAANEAIDARDPAADVVLGGMPELAGSHKAIRGSEYLEQLYGVSGVKDNFDGVAPHPYGATLAKVSSQIELYRKVMKRAGDSGASMYVTEVGAGSASGGSSLNRGTQGQATLLTQIYKYFAKQRSKFNVEAVDWFSWMDSKSSICSWCSSSGLLSTKGKAKPSFKAFTKLSGGTAG